MSNLGIRSLDSNEYVLAKLPLKPHKSQHTITGEFSELVNEPIIGDPSDLARLIFVLKNVQAESQECESFGSEEELQQSICFHVSSIFDCSGEMATRTCLETVLNYGFFRLETDAVSGRKRYVIKDRDELDLSHDWFCFLCDVVISNHDKQYLACSQCPRVFHRKCCLEFGSASAYICLYCQLFQQTLLNDKLKADRNRVSRVIGFLLTFVKTKMKDKIDKLKSNEEANDYSFVFKRMDLQIIENKVDEGVYESVNNFHDDLFFFMHNYHAQIHQDFYQDVCDLLCFITKEFHEIQKCLDCYERSNDQQLRETNEDWFSLPCDPPHQLVFVKVKGYPHWPAKVIHTYENKKGEKKLEIRFFDHKFQKMEVSTHSIFPVQDHTLREMVKKNNQTKKAIKMLEKCEELLKSCDQSYRIESTSKYNFEMASSPSFSSPNQKPPKKGRIRSDARQISTPTQPLRKKNKNSTYADTIESVVKNVDDSESDSNPIKGVSDEPQVRSASKRGRKKKCQLINSDDCSSPPVLEMAFNYQMPVLEPEEPLVTPSDQQIRQKRRSERVRNKECDKFSQLTDKQKKEVIVSIDGHTEPDLMANKSCKPQLKSESTLSQSTDDINEESNSQTDESSLRPLLSGVTPNESSAPLVTNGSVSSISSLPLSKSPSNPSQNLMANSSQSDPKEADSELTDFERNFERLGLAEPSDGSDPFAGIDIIYHLPPYIEAQDRLNQIMDQLENMRAPINKNDFDEKFAVLRVRQNKLKEAVLQMIRLMEKKLKQVHNRNKEIEAQLFEAKTKRWCAVCLEPGSKFCCFRIYCSQKCQLIDWNRGHHKQCLRLKEVSDNNSNNDSQMLSENGSKDIHKD